MFFLKNSYAGNIGYDNTSLSLTANESNTFTRYFTQIIPTSDTTITKLGIVQPASGSGSLGRIILTIYSNNAATNVPSILLGQTSIASQSYGGGNLEIALSSSIDLTANTKYWVGGIPVDGHNSYMGFKYICSQANSVKFAYFSTTNSSSNPTTALNNWQSYPNAIAAPSATCAIGHYAVEGTVNAVPTLSSSVPADDATGIERDANIVLNFSESVDVESGNVTIKKTSDNSIVETIDVTGSKVTGSGSAQITINPSSKFEAETEYYVLIDATAFDDVDSGSYVGISSTTALSFTTESMTDPLTDKDVVGLIDTQYQLAKNIVNQSTSTVSNRLSYLRQNRGSNNFCL